MGIPRPPVNQAERSLASSSRAKSRPRGSEYGYSGTVRLFLAAGDFSASFGFHPHFGRNDIKTIEFKPSPLGEGGTSVSEAIRVTNDGNRPYKKPNVHNVISSEGEAVVEKSPALETRTKLNGTPLNPCPPPIGRENKTYKIITAKRSNYYERRH